MLEYLIKAVEWIWYYDLMIHKGNCLKNETLQRIVCMKLSNTVT